MNLILLFPEDFLPRSPESASAEGRVVLRGRRLEHVRGVHQPEPGQRLCVGVADGRIGEGEVVSLSSKELVLEVRLSRDPPPPLPVDLILALPRPLVLRRVLIAATSMGVKRIDLVHARRVEKSFWQSSAAAEESVRAQLVLGLEQAVDTRLPEVRMHRRFRPFVEDVLPGLLIGSAGSGGSEEPLGLVAHPDSKELCPRAVAGPVTLAVGPEGGFVEYEIEKLVEAGLRPVGLGERVLRVESAVPALLARLF